MHIVLLGAPGSGKSSIASGFAARSFGKYEHLSSGDIARHLAECDELTQTALTRGEYAPEAAMRAEMAARIERAVLNNKFLIIDGFPRMLAQVVVLEEILKEPPRYIEILCPPYVCLRRAVIRGRKHDKPDSIASRFEAYKRDTKSVIEMLRKSSAIYSLRNHPGSEESAINELIRIAGVR